MNPKLWIHGSIGTPSRKTTSGKHISVLLLLACLIPLCTFASDQSETEATRNASWMEDRLHGYRYHTLTTFTLPATHDSAMYTTSLNSSWFWPDWVDGYVKNLARTQNYSIGEQLDYGVRIFNLRPKWYGGYGFKIHHSEELFLGIYASANGPTLQTVLGDIRDYMEEGHRELIILSFSHYLTRISLQEEPFDKTAYERMQLLINEYLGPWLLTSDQIPAGLNLANTPFCDLIGDQGRILLLCEEKWWTFTDPTIGIWPPSALAKAKGKYTNTDSKNKMMSTQAEQFRTNNAVRAKLMWTMTVQKEWGIWDASVRKLAKKINPDLWDFVEGLTIPNTNGNVINEIWVDFVENTGVTDLAIELNNQWPDCVITAPSIVGGGTMGVLLDGSESSDPDGDELTFEWSQISGPMSVTMYNTNSAIAAFDAPITGCGCIFEFMLVVTDERGAYCWDSVEIEVIDVTPATLYCDAPVSIGPPNTPVTYTAWAVDNCDTNPVVEISGYHCYKITGSGKHLDMTKSAKTKISGSQISLMKTGGVGTYHVWTITATDDSENISTGECSLEIVNPGKKKK